MIVLLDVGTDGPAVYGFGMMLGNAERRSVDPYLDWGKFSFVRGRFGGLSCSVRGVLSFLGQFRGVGGKDFEFGLGRLPDRKVVRAGH